MCKYTYIYIYIQNIQKIVEKKLQNKLKKQAKQAHRGLQSLSRASRRTYTCIPILLLIPVPIYKKNRQNIDKISSKICTKNRHKQLKEASRASLEGLEGLLRS